MLHFDDRHLLADTDKNDFGCPVSDEVVVG